MVGAQANSQLCIYLAHDKTVAAFQNLNECLNDVKLNSDKRNALCLGQNSNKKQVKSPNFQNRTFWLLLCFP